MATTKFQTSISKALKSPTTLLLSLHFAGEFRQTCSHCLPFHLCMPIFDTEKGMGFRTVSGSISSSTFQTGSWHIHIIFIVFLFRNIWIPLTFGIAFQTWLFHHKNDADIIHFNGMWMRWTKLFIIKLFLTSSDTHQIHQIVLRRW